MNHCKHCGTVAKPVQSPYRDAMECVCCRVTIRETKPAVKHGSHESALMEALVDFAKMGIRVTSIAMDRWDFLRLALEMHIDQQGEDLHPVPLPSHGASFSFSATTAMETRGVYSSVRVGQSFIVHGPSGDVRIDSE